MNFPDFNSQNYGYNQQNYQYAQNQNYPNNNFNYQINTQNQNFNQNNNNNNNYNQNQQNKKNEPFFNPNYLISRKLMDIPENEFTDFISSLNISGLKELKQKIENFSYNDKIIGEFNTLGHLVEKFYGFKGAISCIIQSKVDWKILASSYDGKIYLFSKPKLDLYKNEETIN